MWRTYENILGLKYDVALVISVATFPTKRATYTLQTKLQTWTQNCFKKCYRQRLIVGSWEQIPCDQVETHPLAILDPHYQLRFVLSFRCLVFGAYYIYIRLSDALNLTKIWDWAGNHFILTKLWVKDNLIISALLVWIGIYISQKCIRAQQIHYNRNNLNAFNFMKTLVISNNTICNVFAKQKKFWDAL